MTQAMKRYRRASRVIAGSRRIVALSRIPMPAIILARRERSENPEAHMTDRQSRRRRRQQRVISSSAQERCFGAMRLMGAESRDPEGVRAPMLQLGVLTMTYAQQLQTARGIAHRESSLNQHDCANILGIFRLRRRVRADCAQDDTMRRASFTSSQGRCRTV